MDKGKAPLVEEGEEDTFLALSPLPSANPKPSLFDHSLSSSVEHFSDDIKLNIPDIPLGTVDPCWAHTDAFGPTDDMDGDQRSAGFKDSPPLFDESDEHLVSMFFDMENFPSSSKVVGSGSPKDDQLVGVAPIPSSQNTENPISASGERPKGRFQRSHSFDGSFLKNSERSIASSSKPLSHRSSNIAKSNAMLDEISLHNPISAFDERLEHRLQRSQSFDGSSFNKLDMLASSSGPMSPRSTRKAKSDAKLVEIALADPRQAKRMILNRQSAAKSKKKKLQYITELEQKAQDLEAHAATLKDRLIMLQNETSGMASENNQLQQQHQLMQEHDSAQAALSQTLQEELSRLRAVTRQFNLDDTGQTMNLRTLPFAGGSQQQFSHFGHEVLQPFVMAQHLQNLRPQQSVHYDGAAQSLLAVQNLQHLRIHPPLDQQQQVQPRLEQELPFQLPTNGDRRGSHNPREGSSADGGSTSRK